jgi:hypothetical protein
MERTMKTLTIEVKDDFMTEFMKIIDTLKDNVIVKKDGVSLGGKNLELDPHFYERQKDLQQIIESDSNTVSHDELWGKVHKHLETIKSK